MLKSKPLPQYGHVVLEGNLYAVIDWLETNTWAAAHINVYCREDTGELRANAVCDAGNGDNRYKFFIVQKEVNANG